MLILTCKCASRHSGVPFFTHFDLQMGFAPQRPAILPGRNFQNWSVIVVFCAFWLANVLRVTAPQRRAIFPDRNFKNGSAIVVFCAFWLTNVLRATAACNFWTSETSKIGPRLWCFVHFDLKMCFAATAACHCSPVCWTGTSAPAALARLLFEHQEPRIIEKTPAVLGVANISRTCSFFLVTLHACGSSFYWLYTRVDLLSADLTSLLCFSTLLTWHLYSAFQLCILSEVRLLNFLRLKSS